MRAERFDDAQGYRTGVDAPGGATPQPGVPTSAVGQIWSEFTLTAGYAPSKQFELRLEARADKANVAAFVTARGAAGASADDGAKLTDKQESLAVQAIYKF